MTIIKIDVTGETCPVPLIEFRKAVRNASSGDIIEIFPLFHQISPVFVVKPVIIDSERASLIGADLDLIEDPVIIRRRKKAQFDRVSDVVRGYKKCIYQ